MADTTEKQLKNGLPKQVKLKDFNRHIKPHLSIRQKGPKPKISSYKTFNYTDIFQNCSELNVYRCFSVYSS